MATLYELKDRMTMVGAQLTKVSNELADKLANPSVAKEDLDELREQKTDLKSRFADLEAMHDEMESADRAAAAKQREAAEAEPQGEAGKALKAKAAAYRKALTGQPLDDADRDIINAAIEAVPAGGGTGGEKLLPTTTGSELVSEPFTKNPLRGVVGMTNITGLRLPKIAFTIDDDSFVGDVETAQELEVTGDEVTFGRFKSKVKAEIADTVLLGSDANLVTYVENALQSGLAAKEKKVMFASAEAQVLGEEHMSFYQEADGSTVITAVEGDSMFAAITDAIAALHEDFRENARVIMRYADYITMVREESALRGDSALYTAPPETVIGKPVIFCDAAVTPVVGDFGYAHINYDLGATYDTDKDVDKGVYKFVLTAWLDVQRKLNSAFRLAKVTAVS